MPMCFNFEKHLNLFHINKVNVLVVINNFIFCDIYIFLLILILKALFYNASC